MQSLASQLKDRETLASNERMQELEDIDRRRISATQLEEAKRRIAERRAMKLVLALFVVFLLSAVILFLGISLSS
jgi:hypothetical protein